MQFNTFLPSKIITRKTKVKEFVPKTNEKPQHSILYCGLVLSYQGSNLD